MDIDDRPTKKRRFFSDDGSAVLVRPDSSNVPSSRPTSAPSSTDTHGSSQTDPADVEHDGPPDTAAGTADGGFDEAMFRTFVGEETLSKEMIEAIKDAAGSNLERAVNMYFEGSWKTTLAARRIESAPSRTIQGWTSSARPTPDVQPASRPTPSPPPAAAMSLKKMPHERYVGSFGVAAWTTRSGINILAAGEAVRIERSRIQPKTKLGRGGKVVQVPSRKSDVVTRFTNLQGEELGRLPEETAKYVSALIDQKVCRFEGHAIFAPERVRVNDTVYLQLRCYILKTAFEPSAFVKAQDDNRATGFFEEKESSEEKDLRLRQVALVKLFAEMNLRSTTSNETVDKHKAQGLLRAAEMAEQHDQDAASRPKTDSTPPSEAEEGVELEDDQLDALYRKAQIFDFNTPVAEPASSFILELRKYQKQALHWMLSKERDQRQTSALMNPLYDVYTWAVKDADDKPLPCVEGQESFYVNLYSGELSLDFPVQESHCLGGILADEMGLGKTIEMFSLMHSNQSEIALAATAQAASKDSILALHRLPQTSSSTEPAPCTTLVVAPMSLLSQWENEAIKSSKPGTMRSLVYYGNEKAANLQTLCSAANAANAPNIIITSYGVVLSEFNQVASVGGDRGSHGGLFSVEFFRVILDEAHTIKNRQAKTSKACYELAAKHRWVLTGTPIVNRLEDLFSLVRFLRVEPWNNFSFWKTFITVPFESKDFVRALNVVQTVLEPLVLRRTKDMRTPNGEYLVPLPKKKVTIEEIELSKTEREVYDLIFTRAKRAFNDSLQAGTLLKSYTTIFAQILRLRQSCCHPVLTRNANLVADEEEKAIAAAADGFADDMDLQELISRFTADASAAEKQNKEAAEEANHTFTGHALLQIQNESSGECPLCLEDPMENPVVIASCFHTACKKCLDGHMDHHRDRGELPKCFSCRETINPREVFEVVKHTKSPTTVSPGSSSDGLYGNAEEEEAAQTRISLRRLMPYSPTAATSAKIAALLKHLTVLPKTTKSVVFSQFTSFLDLISPQLTRHNIHHVRLDGTFSQKARSQVLKTFTAENASDPNAPRVLLLSLRAGGVGLNLTAASHCYMMDPWWAYSVELQAQDRVHRMGQTSNVEVIRFITKESIEGRMLNVQERKLAIGATLGIGQSQGEGGEDEKKRRRIEELQMLLG